MQLYDDILLFIPFEKAAEFFEMPSNNVTSYEIMLSDKSRIAELALEIEDFLGYPHYALTVYDLHRSIFLWIELQQEPIPIVLGLITIVAVLNIITTLLITVVEKTHTIGILRTLGLSRRKVLGIFLYRGFKIGLTGTIIGSTIGYGFCIIQQKYEIIKLQGDIYFLDALPVHFDVLHLLLIASLTLVFSVLASMFPALAALKITPLKAIRFK
jgi:lipoprotein-releasing system permease protein